MKGGKKRSVRVDADAAAIVAAERFRVSVQFAIQRLMMEQKVTQTELAERLGLTQPRVSKFFSSDCNLTIRNLARIFHALGDECFVWSQKLDGLAQEGKMPAPKCGVGAKLRVAQPVTMESSWVLEASKADDGPLIYSDAELGQPAPKHFHAPKTASVPPRQIADVPVEAA